MGREVVLVHHLFLFREKEKKDKVKGEAPPPAPPPPKTRKEKKIFEKGGVGFISMLFSLSPQSHLACSNLYH